MEVNTGDVCAECVKDERKRMAANKDKGRITLLCDVHAPLARHMCINGHPVGRAGYVFDTLFCDQCYNNVEKVCKGKDCGKLHTNRHRDFCEHCQMKINNNICVSCGADTYQGTVGNRGECKDCE